MVNEAQDTMFSSFKPTTKNGYQLDEVVSALQKAIRRGDEELALYFALEMTPFYAMYCFKRLLVISTEDIEDPAACSIVYPMFQSFCVLNEKKKANDYGCFLFVVKAVLYLSRAKKSRESDHAFFYTSSRKDRPAIPEYALDVHTSRGRSAGKTKDAFVFKEQNELENKGRDDYYPKLK
jgi:replication-associated recombination protein RarA